MTSQSEQLLKKFREKFPSDEWIKGNLYTRSDNMLLYGLDDIEEFFLEALPQVQKESFDRGFEEGKKAEKTKEHEHEWRQLIDPWSLDGAYGGGSCKTRFYCIKCLELKS